MQSGATLSVGTASSTTGDDASFTVTAKRLIDTTADGGTAGGTGTAAALAITVGQDTASAELDTGATVTVQGNLTSDSDPDQRRAYHRHHRVRRAVRRVRARHRAGQHRCDDRRRGRGARYRVTDRDWRHQQHHHGDRRAAGHPGEFPKRRSGHRPGTGLPRQSRRSRAPHPGRRRWVVRGRCRNGARRRDRPRLGDRAAGDRREGGRHRAGDRPHRERAGHCDHQGRRLGGRSRRGDRRRAGAADRPGDHPGRDRKSGVGARYRPDGGFVHHRHQRDADRRRHLHGAGDLGRRRHQCRRRRRDGDRRRRHHGAGIAGQRRHLQRYRDGGAGRGRHQHLECRCQRAWRRC